MDWIRPLNNLSTYTTSAIACTAHAHERPVQSRVQSPGFALAHSQQARRNAYVITYGYIRGIPGILGQVQGRKRQKPHLLFNDSLTGSSPYPASSSYSVHSAHVQGNSLATVYIYSACNLKSRIPQICEFWYINVNILTLKHF